MKKVILLMLLAGLFVGCKGEVDNGEHGTEISKVRYLKVKITNNLPNEYSEEGYERGAISYMYIEYFGEDNSVKRIAYSCYTSAGCIQTYDIFIKQDFPISNVAIIKSIYFRYDFSDPKEFYIYGKPDGFRGLETQLSTQMVTDFMFHEKLLDLTWNADGSVTLNNE